MAHLVLHLHRTVNVAFVLQLLAGFTGSGRGRSFALVMLMGCVMIDPTLGSPACPLKRSWRTEPGTLTKAVPPSLTSTFRRKTAASNPLSSTTSMMPCEFSTVAAMGTEARATGPVVGNTQHVPHLAHLWMQVHEATIDRGRAEKGCSGGAEGHTIRHSLARCPVNLCQV